jgi:hypothetical protein
MIMATATYNTYYILSGEGTYGTWEKVETTERGIKSRLTKKRCNGDRTAKAFVDIFETAQDGWAGRNVETGEMGFIPNDVVESEIVETRTEMIDRLQRRHPGTRRQRNSHGAGQFSVDFFDKTTGERVASYAV